VIGAAGSGSGQGTAGGAPRQIGRYQVVREIACGGMGVVYRAWDPVAQREVALKLMLSGGLTEKRRKRFLLEAQAMGRLQHPNVVRLLDYELTPEGRPCMALELVEGDSLQRRLETGGPFDPDDALRAAITICDAVAACHAAGTLHRDLKPENVLVAPDGTLKLTDFGLVRQLDASLSGSRLTEEGKVFGSPGYWAPELAAGDLEQIDARTDVYGVGATLYALLTAQPPHQGSSLVEVMAAAHAEKTPPSAIAREVPAWLDAVVLRAMAPDPERRYESVADLRRALAEGPAARPGLPAGALLAAGSLVAALLVALALVVLDDDSLAARPPVGEEPVPATAPDPSPPAPPSQQPAAPSDPEPDRRAAAEEARQRGIALSTTANRTGDTQDWQATLVAFEEAVRLDPSYPEAYYGRGGAHSRLGDWRGALEDYAAAIRLRPSFHMAYAQRASVRERLGDQAGAFEDLDTVIRLAPSAHAYVNRAAAHGRAGQRFAEIEDCDEAIRLDPTLPSAYYNRGLAWAGLEEWARVVEDMNASLRLRPTHASSFFNRGVGRTNLGAYADARDDFERALELDPRATWAAQARQNITLVERLLREAGGG
jgi:tetratricopeptide (TPR) repeat protein